MAPIVHGLEAEYSERINFVYLDIDDPANSDLLSFLGYRYQPHFFLIDGDGKVLIQWLGPVTAADFKSAFDSQLQ
jgi:hypothetical protein